MSRHLLPLLLLTLAACDEPQRNPNRSAADALDSLSDTYNCPQDAEADGYLMAPVPTGLVQMSAWTCYPTDIYGGTFVEGCQQESATLLHAKEEGMDYAYMRCDEGTIRLDWLVLAD